MDRLIIGALAAASLVVTACQKPPSGGGKSTSTANLSPEFRSFLTATKELDNVAVELARLLEGIDSPQAAADAKPHLVELAPKLEAAARKAADAAEGMESSAKAKKEMMRLHIQGTVADAEWADKVRVEYGLDEQKGAPPNIVEALIKAAGSPNTEPIAAELARFRDIILNSRPPLGPPRAHEIVEKTLGPAGSPLTTQPLATEDERTTAK